MPHAKTAKDIYTLGRSGSAALIEHGFAPHKLATVRLRQNELKEFGPRDAVFISDIHAKLLRLLRGEKSLSLTHWAEGPSLWDTVKTSERVTIPIRPNAWFVIGAGQRNAHFSLEADRGTMFHSRMREEISGYAAYFQQQRHVKKYDGIKVFRVATITETRGRAQGLADEFGGMMPAAWLAVYPVIAFEDLTIQTLM